MDDASVYRLRPLTAGEVFDRTFAVYRQHFWLFTGISFVPAFVSLLGGIARIALFQLLRLPATTNELSNPIIAAFVFFWSILSLAVYGSSQAASTIAVSSVYLGRPATFRSSYGGSLKHWFRYPLLIVVQFISASWMAAVVFLVLLILVGIFAAASGGASGPLTGLLVILVFILCCPFVLYRYSRVALAMPASTIEDLRIRAALKRSKLLTRERKLRVALVFILLGALYIVVASCVSLLSVAASRGNMRMIVAQVISLLTMFVVSLLLQPIGAISLCLFYFDERVRHEGFDLEFMLQNAGASPAFQDTAQSVEGVAQG